MKPSKTKKNKRRRKPSPDPPPQPSNLGGGGDDPHAKREERRGGEDEESKTLNWLISAFSSASLDQINSAYQEAGGDPYTAAGILGANLVDPEEAPPERNKGFRVQRPKRVSTATGMVSNVIGKQYLKPYPTLRRNHEVSLEENGALKHPYSREEAEEFLGSMLGDNSELGMDVVKDVLGQCGCDIEKALDALLNISASSCVYLRERSSDDSMKDSMEHSGICPEICSRNSSDKIITDGTSDSTYHPSEKEHDFLQYKGYNHRDNMKVLPDFMEHTMSSSRIVKTDLPQKVLEALFNSPIYNKVEPNCMDWKKVVKKVESLGQGLEFHLTSMTDPMQNATNGKDAYVKFRSVAKKHWDEMRDFYQKAAIAYSGGERSYAAYLSERGKYYRRLAHEADEKASREIFEARNKDIKNTVSIDLHGQHVKQAIGLLKLHLLLFAYIPSIKFLKVITGCGADGVGKGRLKRTVVGLLEKEGIEWKEENAGSIVLQLVAQKEYSFKECDSESE